MKDEIVTLKVAFPLPLKEWPEEGTPYYIRGNNPGDPIHSCTWTGSGNDITALATRVAYATRRGATIATENPQLRHQASWGNGSLISAHGLTWGSDRRTPRERALCSPSRRGI